MRRSDQKKRATWRSRLDAPTTKARWTWTSVKRFWPIVGMGLVSLAVWAGGSPDAWVRIATQPATPEATAGEPLSSTTSGVSSASLEPAVSNVIERRVAHLLEATVPELTELYIQPQRGGYAIIATASVSGLEDVKLVSEDISSRYLTAAYDQLTGLPVLFASLYIEEDGRYIMASGLGRQEAMKLSIQTFAPDQGDDLTAQLARISQYTSPLTAQGFAEFKGL